MPETAKQAIALSAQRYWKETESVRLTRSQRIWYWIYNEQDFIINYIKEGMAKMFSAETINKINIRVFNIVPQVVDKLGFVYKENPQRTLDGGIQSDTDENGKIVTKQSEDDKRYQEALKKSTIEKKQNEWDKLSNPFNTILVQPVWREEKDKSKSYMDFLIHTPAWCEVETSKNDWLKPKAFYYKIWMQLKEGEPEEQVVVYWSETEHYVVDANENKKSVKGNEEKVNPYGLLPAVALRVRDGIDFWGEGWWDLIGGNEEICEQVSSLFYTAKFQGFGIAVGTNIGESELKKGEPKLSPDTVVTIGNGARSDEVTPDLKYINANPMLAEVQGLVDWAIQSIQKLKGLTPEQYQTEVGKVSGIAKSIDNSSIEEIRKNKTNICRMFEADLFEVFRAVYNYHNPSSKISESAEFSIKFPEPKILESQDDKNKRREFGLKNDILSRVKIIKEDNPGMTDEEAQKEFESIIAQNRMVKDEYGMNDIQNTDMMKNGVGNEDSNLLTNPNQTSADSQNLNIEKG
jgi:hypothetical protein